MYTALRSSRNIEVVTQFLFIKVKLSLLDGMALLNVSADMHIIAKNFSSTIRNFGDRSFRNVAYNILK